MPTIDLSMWQFNNTNVMGCQLNEIYGIQLNNFSSEESDLGRVFGTPRSMNVPDAKYDSRNRRVPPCSHDTRVDILAKIKQWILEPQDHAVCWLHGMAGSGKSAIAQTISEFCTRESKLAASFFFDRQHKDRSIPDNFVVTIVNQTATIIPESKRPICEVLKGDESILNGLLENQLQKLVIEPLQSLSGSDFPFVIVIDALDECEDFLTVAQILTTLADPTFNSHFPFRLFITSRPEPSIQILFDKLATLQYDLQDFNPDPDIRSYFTEELDNIRRMRQFVIPDPTWPSSKQIDQLVQTSSGLFIHASTVVKFIGDERCNPQSQLDVLLNIENSTGSDTYSDLDGLYKQVLEGFPYSLKHMRVLSTIILLQDPLGPRDIALLLGRKIEDVLLPLERLHSILSIPQDLHTGHVTIFHSSLHDFLTSEQRAGKYFVDLSLRHSDLAECCLRYMIKTLPKYPSSTLLWPGQRRLANCWRTINEHLDLGDSPSATRYACRHWPSHLTRLLLTYHWLFRFIPYFLFSVEVYTNSLVREFCMYYALPCRIFLEIDAQNDAQNEGPQIGGRERDREWEMERVLEPELFQVLIMLLSCSAVIAIVIFALVELASSSSHWGGPLFVVPPVVMLSIITIIVLLCLPWGPIFLSGLVDPVQLQHRGVHRSYYVQAKSIIDKLNVLGCSMFYLAFSKRVTRMLEIQFPQTAANNASDEHA